MAALKVFHFRVFHIPKWMEHHYSRKWNVSHGFRLWCVCACLFSVFAYSFRPLCFFQLPQDEEQETEKSRTEARPVEGRRHATGCQRSERWSAKSKSSSKSLQLVTWISPEACERTCSKHWTLQLTIYSTQCTRWAISGKSLLVNCSHVVDFLWNASSSDHLRCSFVNSDTVII